MDARFEAPEIIEPNSHIATTAVVAQAAVVDHEKPTRWP
jgi:hypothetical protein